MVRNDERTHLKIFVVGKSVVYPKHTGGNKIGYENIHSVVASRDQNENNTYDGCCPRAPMKQCKSLRRI